MGMETFGSKYSEIEAFHYDGSEEARQQLSDLAIPDVHIWNEGKVQVTTNNGAVELLPGHWLVKGVSDYYPCDPQTFEARWERVDDSRYVVVHQRDDGDWGWTRRATGSHTKVGTSGEGFEDKAYAVLSAHKENPGVRIEIEESSTDG